MAITDHDTTGGWAEAEAARPPGLTLVRGAELSCRWHGISLHLLAYLFDPENERLTSDLARLREDRERRAEKMVQLMELDGLDISWAEVSGYAAGGSVGRPHIAQALIRAKLCRTTDEAFKQWLSGKYFLRKADLDVFDAIDAVKAAGGVTVFAHPKATVRGPVVPNKAIREMAEAGLFGLEADHENHLPEQQAEVRKLADKFGLIVTGSSDFHGTHKRVQLGAHVTEVAAYEQIIATATGVPVLG